MLRSSRDEGGIQWHLNFGPTANAVTKTCRRHRQSRESVLLNVLSVPTASIVWTAGVKPRSPLPSDDAHPLGRIEVDDRFRVAGTTSTYAIGDKPTHGVVSADNSALWVAASGNDSVSLYSIDDGKLISGVRTGSGPDAIAFSADEHLLLVADSHTGDVAIFRTQGTEPALVTMLPAGGHPNDIAIKAFTAK